MPRIVKNRRVLMRIAFVVACILPTLSLLAISTVALARRSAAEANEHWRSALELQLGLSVEIERTERAALGVTLHDVAIRHPESKALIVRIRQVYIAQAAERGWIVECRYPELDADGFPDVWNILNDRLTNRRGITDWSGTLTATNIAWREGADIATIPQVQCNMRHSAQSSECRVEYFLEEQDPTAPSSLVISRDRESRDSSIRYDWETTSGPFPLRWLWQSNPGLKRLGSHAAFDGHAKIRRAISGTTDGSLEGEVQGVDLAELVSRPFPHHILRGRAQLVFNTLNWEANRVTDYSGNLSSDNGRVSRSLLDAAAHVGLEIPVRLTNLPLFGFRRLRLSFAGRGDTLELHGADMGGNVDDVVVLGADDPDFTPLLVATGAEADTAGLLRWMVPHSTHLVPATPHVGYLANFFQLPTIDPGDRDSLQTPAVNLGPPIEEDE
jgi:hypothetical protein